MRFVTKIQVLSFTIVQRQVWYGIVEFNVPFDTV